MIKGDLLSFPHGGRIEPTGDSDSGAGLDIAPEMRDKLAEAAILKTPNYNPDKFAYFILTIVPAIDEIKKRRQGDADYEEQLSREVIAVAAYSDEDIMAEVNSAREDLIYNNFAFYAALLDAINYRIDHPSKPKIE